MTTRRDTAQKVTITVPAELLAYAAEVAERLGISRSEVIARALAAQRKRERDELAAEGYRFYSAESSEFAEVAASPFAEVLGDDH